MLRKNACRAQEAVVDAEALGLRREEELPSGATLRGVFVIAGTDTPAVAGRASSAISFGVPLAEAPEPHLVFEGATASTECPGAVNDPAATPGHLRIYVGASGNAFNLNFGDPISGRGPGSSRFGVWVAAVGDFDSNYGVTGTWAVTAP